MLGLGILSAETDQEEKYWQIWVYNRTGYTFTFALSPLGSSEILELGPTKKNGVLFYSGKENITPNTKLQLKLAGSTVTYEPRLADIKDGEKIAFMPQKGEGMNVIIKKDIRKTASGTRVFVIELEKGS